MTLTTKAKVFAHGSTASDPITIFFDFAAAFPSLNHAFSRFLCSGGFG